MFYSLSGGDGSNVLRKVDLNIWSEEQCEQRYPGWFTNTMLCAYKQGADTCHVSNSYMCKINIMSTKPE